jgi:hypothetical protein
MIRRTLWIVNFLLALANFIVGVAVTSFTCYLASIVCALVCVIYYKSTWGN